MKRVRYFDLVSMGAPTPGGRFSGQICTIDCLPLFAAAIRRVEHLTLRQESVARSDATSNFHPMGWGTGAMIFSYRTRSPAILTAPR